MLMIKDIFNVQWMENYLLLECGVSYVSTSCGSTP